MPPPAPSAADIDVGAIQRGERAAFVVLADVWLDRMHDAAQNIVGSADAATEICAGLFGLLWSRHADIAPSDVTRESLLLATRGRALAHLDRHGWSAPGDDLSVRQSGTAASATGGSTTGHRVVLAHAVATVIGARTVSTVDLHYRHGVDAAALSRALGVTNEESLRRLATLRDELGEVVAAFGLWNSGRPVCADLAQALGGATPFGNDVFERIGHHRVTCSECARRYRSLVNPASTFIAAPVRNVALSVRQRVLAATAGPADGTPPARSSGPTGATAPAPTVTEDIAEAAAPTPEEPSPAAESAVAPGSTPTGSSSAPVLRSGPATDSSSTPETDHDDLVLDLDGLDDVGFDEVGRDDAEFEDVQPEADDRAGDRADVDLDDLWGPARTRATAATTATAATAATTVGPDVGDIWERAATSPPDPADAAATQADGSDDVDLHELWTTPATPPARATPAAPASSGTVEAPKPTSTSHATIVPVDPDADRRRRGVVALVAGAAAVVVVSGTALLALSGSGDRNPAAAEPVSDFAWPPTDDEPEVRSLGPIPPTTHSATQPATAVEPAASTTPPSTTTPVTTEPAPVELSERNELFVVAANGASVARAASRMATRLDGLGYADVVPLDGTDIFEFTVVYYADGYQEAALRMADDLYLLPDFVAPLADAPGVAELPDGVELLVYIGRDRA